LGKNKLARWNELKSWTNVIEPEISSVVENRAPCDNDPDRFPSWNVTVKDHPVKGRWKSEIFKNSNPVVLELGCGRGEYTTGLSIRFPGKNFVGVDIKGARLWRGAKTSNELNLQNTAFLRTRIEFINSFFGRDEADEIWITFPDPHPGMRNANKRLTSPWYLNSYRKFVRDNGIIHLKTDNTELFEYTLKVIRNNKLELLASTKDLYAENYPDDILSIKTHYEQIFLSTGLKICYLSFRLPSDKYIRDETQRQ
jgi:tRNA (guanine-N7-)-methyltransferase